MDSLAYITPWVLGSVCVGVVAGFYLGRSMASRPKEEDVVERQRQATLQVLVELLGSAERMNSQVETHNTEIRETAHHVGELDANGGMESVKQALLGHMETLLASNQRLNQDLTYSRYRMEEQAEQIDDARREARTDALTTVANRKALNEKLHLVMTDFQRQGQPFVLVLIDLDRFKRINDAHGHQAGDRVLAKVGTWLRQWVREGDFVGRYGGDEFALLLPHTDLEAGLQLAETIRRRTADRASRVALRKEQVSLSFSTGVAAVRPDDTIESLLERADRALYKSKHLGRNQVQAEAPAQQEEPATAGQPA